MILVFIAAPLVLLGLGCGVLAVGARHFHGWRIRRPRVPVSVLSPGPVALAGLLRAAEHPLRAVDDTPVLALHTRLDAQFESDDSYQSVRKAAVFASIDAELTDDSGTAERPATCTVDTGSVLMLGTDRRCFVEAGTFRRERPGLWALLAVPENRKVTRVEVLERFVPDGASVVVFGEALPNAAAADGSCRVTGTHDRPLLLAVGTEPDVRRMFLRPIQVFVVLAMFCFAAAGALLLAWQIIGS